MSKNKEALLLAVAKGYRIDEFGNVFSMKNIIVKPHINTGGYKVFYINFSGKKTKAVYFSRLQAYQKYTESMFEIGIVVRHLNGNQLDDSYDNIALGTSRENSLDILPEERFKSAVNATQFCRVWTDSQLQEIFDDKYIKGFSYKDLREKYNIAKSTCSFLFNKSLFSKTYAKVIAV